MKKVEIYKGKKGSVYVVRNGKPYFVSTTGKLIPTLYFPNCRLSNDLGIYENAQLIANWTEK